MARILVIDDNTDLLQMVRVLLEERGGHETLLSTDGEDGLAKARANTPDLAIIDVMMPGITGYEVCRRLRRDPATAQMPIIILTARGQSVDRDAALEAGANDYLTKPVTMNELLDHVTGLLARTAAASAPPGETVALLGLRGGMGVTTLATNLALIFAGQSPDKVCLVDLNPSSGHVALQLGMRPEPNWSAFGDVAPDRERIREYLLVHPARLHVLAAPYVPVIGQGLGPDTVTALLAALRQNFSTVVVDTPAVLTEGAAAALDAADVIGVVVTADPMAIQTAIGTLQTLQPLASKVQLILNQIVPGPPPPVDVLQRVLKRAFAGVVLYDPAQAQALVSGKPLALTSAASPLAQEVRVLAGRLRIRQAQPAGVL